MKISIAAVTFFFMFLNVSFSSENQGTDTREQSAFQSDANSGEGQNAGSAQAQEAQRGDTGRISNKRRAAGYYGAGRRAYKRKRFLKASKWFLKATGLNPSRAKYHYYLGKSYYYTKKYESSFNALKAAVKIDPECRFSKYPSNFKKMYKKIEELSRKNGDSLFRADQREGYERGDRRREERGGLSVANKIGIALLILAALLGLIYFIRKKRA
jgi:tetratricopeptide (TPR) repeat protein